MAILRALYLQENPLGFNEIERTVQKLENRALNLTYHLGKLKEQKYILGDQTGYQLTPLGKAVYKEISHFFEAITAENPILVRTSRYSFEPFNADIIQQKLVLEANVPDDRAAAIANEAKQRLLRAQIHYLTAPLIREYINAILIEHHLEDYRHKLTRLGVPPYDILQLLRNHDFADFPQFQGHLGSQILEQYTLLNVLNQKYADRVLAGAIILTDLRYFAFSPLEIVISGEDVWRLTHLDTKIGSTRENKSDQQLQIKDFSCRLQAIWERLMSIFPYGVSIFGFEEFIERFLRIYTIDDFIVLFQCGFSPPMHQPIWRINICFSIQTNRINLNALYAAYNNVHSLNKPFLHIFIPDHMKKECIISESENECSKIGNQILNILRDWPSALDQFTQWGQSNLFHAFTNLEIPFHHPRSSPLIPWITIEKISINVLEIYTQSQSKGFDFLKEFEKSVYMVFDYGEEKAELLRKNLVHFHSWTDLQPLLTSNSHMNVEIPMVCGISLHGLDEMIYMKSGFFIKDLSDNRQFVLSILNSVSNLISKQNQQSNHLVKFQLSEPHLQKEIQNPANSILIPFQEKFACEHPEITEIHESYWINYHQDRPDLSQSHIFQIYEDLSQGEWREMSLKYPRALLEEGDYPQCGIDLLKQFFDTKICRISIER